MFQKGDNIIIIGSVQLSISPNEKQISLPFFTVTVQIFYLQLDNSALTVSVISVFVRILTGRCGTHHRYSNYVGMMF